MDGASGKPYAAPEVAAGELRICDKIKVDRGVEFAIVAGLEGDPISEILIQGTYPAEYRNLLDLVRATAPAGGRVLDLGAHIGTFSLGVAAAGFEVLAVEASPRNASLLRASIERNRFHRMRLVHAAVGDGPGFLDFCQCGPYGHVANPMTSLPSVRVPCIAVDDLLAEHGWERVDFIKMDIEGSEVVGLRGLHKLLARADAPPILVESNGHTLNFFGQTPESLKATLEGFGYVNYLVEAGRLRPVGVRDVQPTTVVDLLAVKPAPKPRKTWRIDPPLSFAETAERVALSCRSPNGDERLYIARALAGAGAELRSEPRVARAIEELRADPVEGIRSVAQAVSTEPPKRSFFARLFG